MKKISGFTLVELMVTIAVLAIIATMAAPSMSQFITSAKVNSEARELSMAIAEARSNAVLTNKPSTIHLGVDDPGNLTEGVAVVDFYWNSDKKVSLDTGENNNITFLPSGIVKGATKDLVFELCSNQIGSTLTISSQGSLRSMTQGACS